MTEKKIDNIKIKKCVGCGYCCITAKCAAGARLYPSSKICNALIWSKEENRYLCDLMRLPGNIGRDYREELYAGEGCCSNLNSWRQDVKNRNINNNNMKMLSLDPIFQIFLHSLGSQFMSSESIKLTLYGMESIMLKNGMDKDEARKTINLIWNNFKNSRPSFQKEFMG